MKEKSKIYSVKPGNNKLVFRPSRKKSILCRVAKGLSLDYLSLANNS